MTIAEMLNQSLILTLLGMCVVFSFLIVMILCMNLLHVVVHAAKLDKNVTENDAAVTTAPTAVNAAVDQKAIVAAIATALHEKN